MIKWIFFDVGSTLVDETEAYDHRIRDMIAGTDVTFEEFDRVRISLALQGLDGNSAAITYFGLKKAPWHSEDEIPFPDVRSTLETLCRKGYKLGIIANQNPGLEKRLQHWGLRQYFEVIAASAEIGCAKPDREIFEWALKRAECAPWQSIMVGDRLDNDIIPAKSIGMKTVWMKSGLAKYQDASFGKGVADYQISSLSELLQLVHEL